jgi:hypothetical protein
MVGRGELKMRIRVCSSGVSGIFYKHSISPHVTLFPSPAERNSLGSIAFSVLHCMQNAELPLLTALLRKQGKGPFRKGSDHLLEWI